MSWREPKDPKSIPKAVRLRDQAAKLKGKADALQRKADALLAVAEALEEPVPVRSITASRKQTVRDGEQPNAKVRRLESPKGSLAARRSYP